MTYIPKPVNQYKGAQAIINSDRIVFNAKEDSILLYSDKAIGFNTRGSIYFDTSDSIDNDSKIVINSPKIYLGLKKNIDADTLPTERAVLGTALRDDLSVDQNNQLTNADNCAFLSNKIYLANKD